jgi:hypothetical protein
MKITEFKDIQKLDELRLDQVVGSYGAAGLKQLGNRLLGRAKGQASVAQRQVMDKFINNFVGDAILNIDQGIQTGLIDPNAATPAATQVDPNTVQQQTPATTAAPAAPAGPARDPDAGAKAKGAYDAQKQTSQNINNYVRKVAADLNATTDKRQKMALTKEIVNFMADRKNYPEWQNAVATVQQVIKKQNPDPNFANAAIERLKAGQVMTEAWQIFWINKLLEAVKISWSDLGLSVLKENNTKKYKIVESKYYKLNNLFEGLLNEAVSISDFIKTRWLPKYARSRNLDYSSDTADVEKMADEIQSSYAKDKGQAALRKLGGMMFTIGNLAGTGGGAGAGAGQAAGTQPAAGAGQATGAGAAPSSQPSAAASAPAQTSTAPVTSAQMAAIIEKYAEKLKGTDAAKYEELMKKLLEKYRMWDELKR